MRTNQEVRGIEFDNDMHGPTKMVVLWAERKGRPDSVLNCQRGLILALM